MPYLHPYIVHFALALLSLAVVSDFIYCVSEKQNFWQLSNLALAAGTLCAILAVLTGTQAAEIAIIPEDVKGMVSSHRASGELTMWLFIGISAVKWILVKMGRFGSRSRWFYYAILLCGFILLFRTGLLGGQMVYFHGVGPEPQQQEKPVIDKPSFK